MNRLGWLAAALAAMLLLGCGGSNSGVQQPNQFEPLPEEGPQSGGLPAPEAPIPPPS